MLHVSEEDTVKAYVNRRTALYQSAFIVPSRADMICGGSGKWSNR